MRLAWPDDPSRCGGAAGFAVTTDAYAAMLDQQGLRDDIARHMTGFDPDDLDQIDRAAQAIRSRSHRLPDGVEGAVRAVAYREKTGSSMPMC